MKRARLTIALLIVLAFMSFGCASLSPSAANSPNLQQEQSNNNPEHGNNWGLWVVYWTFYNVGELLAAK